MPDVEIELTAPAADFFNRASADDQRELDRIFTNIRQDPYIDNQVKLVFHYPPAAGVLYVHPQFGIFYHHVGNQKISIIAIWPRRSMGRFMPS